MHIVIAGGHGQVALHLTRQLAERGDQVRGIIRDPGQSGDLQAAGAEAVVLDLEQATPADLADVIADADAVVFAAGAGPDSGAERKETVDYGAAAALVEAAQRAGTDRYVMVSAMGTDDPPQDDAVFSVYLRAKARADRALMASDLAWTVVRPGRLTDAEGTGTVTLARHVPRAEIPRADVAAVCAACLHEPATAGHVFEVVTGDVPVGDAVASLVAR